MSSATVMGVGLVAQGLFGSRFLVQWLASEKAGRSVIPSAFWILSVAGSVLLLTYAWLRHDPIFIAAQSMALLVYVRNLQLLYWHTETAPRDAETWYGLPLGAAFLLAAMGVTTAAAASAAIRMESPTAPLLLVVGLIGQFVFGIRFAVQLAASERQGHSVMPLGFWYCSIVGSVLLLVYASARRDPVFILAHAPNLLVYGRNLFLVRRESLRTDGQVRSRRHSSGMGALLRTAAHRVQFALLMALRLLLLPLPRSWQLALGSALGLCCYHLRIRRGVVEKNLVFTGMADGTEKAAGLSHRIYGAVGRSLVDSLTLSRRHMPPMIIENEAGLFGPEDTPRGVLLISGHYGNWELLLHIMAERFPRLGVVTKPMRNPWFNRWLSGQRCAPGVQLIEPRHAMRRSLGLLRREHAVAYLIDQYAGRHGTRIPFLGKPALTVRSAAGIAALTHCRILAGYAVADADGVYHVHFRELPNPPVSKKDRAGAVLRLLNEHNEILTSWVRSHPEQWFGWFHRRFKDSVSY